MTQGINNVVKFLGKFLTSLEQIICLLCHRLLTKWLYQKINEFLTYNDTENQQGCYYLANFNSQLSKLYGFLCHQLLM